MDRKEYQNFLATVLVVFVVLKGGIPKVFAGTAEGRLMPVLIMYFIAGYLKRFRTSQDSNARKHFAIAAIFYILLFSSFYLLTYMGMKLDSETIMENRYFYRLLNSPFVVIISCALFIGTMETEMKYSKRINTIAGCTFGVYLIHANRLMGVFLRKCFPIYKETCSTYIFVYSFFAVIVIYLGCTFIEYIRKITFGRLWCLLLDKKVDKIQNRLCAIASKLSRVCQVNSL